MVSIDDHHLNRIIGSIYQAAFDSTAWAGTIETLRSSLNGSHACITRVGPDLRLDDVISTQTDPYFAHLYLEDERFHASDLVPPFLRAPVGVVLRHEELKGADHLYRSPMWNEWMLPQDIVATLNVKVIKETRSSWVFNIARGRKQPAWDDPDKDIFETLMPHVRSAIEIGRSRAIEHASGTSRPGRAPGIVSVNPDLRIVRLDATAATILDRSGCPIRRERDYLQVDPAQRSRLAELAGAASLRIDLKAGFGGYMRLRADPQIEGAYDLALSVGPAVEPGEGFLLEPMAIILIRELSPAPAPELALAVQAIFDLTPAEGRLALALSSGQSLEIAAAASAITVKSARTYLERIFRKTGTHQQGQLVALLKTVHSFPVH